MPRLVDERQGVEQGAQARDRNSFFVLLAFLNRLPDPADQARVLRRRLAFMDEPGSYFYEDGRPLCVRDMTDRFRRGMLQFAAASSRADRAWLERGRDRSSDPALTVCP